MAASSSIVSKDIPDIEVSDYRVLVLDLKKRYLFTTYLLLFYTLFLHGKNLLGLNPKSKPYVNLVPSTQTKENKKHWKRNIHSKCDVSILEFSIMALYFWFQSN